MMYRRKSKSGDFPGSGLIVPGRLALSDKDLIWQSQGDDGAMFRRVKSGGRTMLQAFLKLANGSERDILEFAQKWGVFGFCAHKLPASHNPSRHFVPLVAQNVGCFPHSAALSDGSKAPFAEPLDFWQTFARQAGALSRVATKLHRGSVGLQDDWNAVFEGIPEASPALIRYPWQSGTLSEEWRLVYHILDDWLSLGNVRPQVQWKQHQGATLSLGGDGLFGALALQLLWEISKTDGIDWCAGCHKLIFSGDMGVRRDQRNHYCDECRGLSGREKPWRDAQRRLRERQRKARQLHETGQPPGAIARTLNSEYGTRTTVDTVRNWIGKKARLGA